MTDVGIFWDIENIRPKSFMVDDLIDYANTLGRVVLRRAYADWVKLTPKTAKELISSNFELFHIPHTKTQKNSADILLASNAINALVQYPNVDCFILVSNDRDFRGLISTLQANGKEVHLICNPSITNTELLAIVDKYYDFNDLPDFDVTPVEEDPVKRLADEITEFKKFLSFHNITISPNYELTGEEAEEKDEPKAVEKEKAIKKGDLVLDKLVEAIKQAYTEKKGVKEVSHYAVVTRLNVIYDNIEDDLKEIKRELKLKSKWFSDLLKVAENKDLIKVRLDGNEYMISLTKEVGQTETEMLKEEYFQFIRKELEKAKTKSLVIAKLAGICDRGLKYSYKDIGYKSFKSALLDAQEEKIIKLERKGLHWEVKI